MLHPIIWSVGGWVSVSTHIVVSSALIIVLAEKQTYFPLSTASRENLASVVSRASKAPAATQGHRGPLVRLASLERPDNPDHQDPLVHLDSQGVQVLLARRALLEHRVTQARG